MSFEYLNMSFKSIKKLFAPKMMLLLTTITVFAMGLMDLMPPKEQNGCQMTFMFQYPQFIAIPMKNRIHLKYPDYHFYAYGEGYAIRLTTRQMTDAFNLIRRYYSQTLREGHFIGSPVIFVPGNGGSYKQVCYGLPLTANYTIIDLKVRSLASVAQRMSDKYSTPYHLNYFTVDFNEEYSAINSMKLEGQTIFLKECVIKTIDMYKKRGRDVSLVLIGHSIGGLIIRALLTLPEFEPYLSKIELIITLATPHKYPVVPIDSKMSLFYQNIEQYWKSYRNRSLSHIYMLSVGGSFHDKLVPSELTRLQSDYRYDMSVITSTIDDVWVSTDHLCIVWCKQLVKKLNRLLFDLIDETSLKLIADKEKMHDIIRYHMRERTLTKNYPKFFVPKNAILPSNAILVENLERIIKISKPKILESIYILMPLFRRESIVVQMEGPYRHDWLTACAVTKENNISLCERSLSLHPYVKRLPSNPYDFERRLFAGSSSHLVNKGFTHFLLALNPSVEPVNIQTDRFNTGLRSKTILMPTLAQSLSMVFTSVRILTIAVSEEKTFYNLSLVGLNQIWNAYSINLDTISCYPTASNLGYVYLWIPWSEEIHFKYVYPKRGESSQMTLKLNTPKPKDDLSSGEPTLYLLLDPNCSYELHLKPSVSEIMGQILRHFGVLLLPMIVSILVSLLSEQIKTCKMIAIQITGHSATKDKHFFEESTNLMKGFRHISMYGLTVVSSAATAVYSNYNGITTATSELTDIQLIILYTILYLISHSLCYLFLVIINFVFLSFLIPFDYISNKFTSSQLKSDTNKLQIKSIPIMTSVLSTILAFVFVTPLLFLASLFAHTFQLLYLMKKCRTKESRLGATIDSTLCRLHLTLLALIFVSTVPTIPLLLDWLNLKMPVLYYGGRDPYLIPGLLTSASCAVFWHQFSERDIREKHTNVLSIILKVIAILASICCQSNYWNICLMISISVFVLSLYQTIQWVSDRNLKCD